MSIIKYKTGWDCSGGIKAVEVLRETNAFVYVSPPGRNGKERRESKFSEYGSYFDTWESAYQSLIAKAERDLECRRIQLQSAQSKLGNIKGMKKPIELA